MFKRSHLAMLVAALLLTAAVGRPARAEIRAEGFEFEIYGGYYDIRAGRLDGEATFGGRFGYSPTPFFTVQASLGYTEFDEDVNDPVTMTAGSVKLEQVNLDFTFAYNFAPTRSVVAEVHAGFGGGFASASGAVQTVDSEVCGGAVSCKVLFDNLSEESFTMIVGGGAKIDLSRMIYLRPVVQARWYARRDDSQWDPEYTLALGFRFGGHSGGL